MSVVTLFCTNSLFLLHFRYTGLLCLACATNYVKEGDSCTKCPNGAKFWDAIIPMLLLCGLLYLCVVVFLLRTSAARSRSGKKRDSGTRFERTTRMKRLNRMFGQGKILISLCQIIASMPSVLVDVNFPPFFLQMSNVFGVFNLDVLSLSSALSCTMSVRFFDRLIIHLLLPICCLLAIGTAVATVRMCVSNKNKRIKMNEVAYKIIVLVILLLFPSLSTKLFSVFKCKSFDGIENSALLVQDYAINCHRGEHVVFKYVAWVFLGLYIAGIPATMFLLLWCNKKHLHDASSIKHYKVKNSYGGLYMQYEPEYWWFELMVLLNKTIMCGGLVLLSPGTPSQVLCAVLIMLFHLLLVLKLSPYLEDHEDVSSFVASLGLTLLYMGALMKMLEDMDGFDEQYSENNLSYIGAVLNVVPVLCVSFVIGIMVVDCFACTRGGGGGGEGGKKKVVVRKKKHQDRTGEIGLRVPPSCATQIVPALSSSSATVAATNDAAQSKSTTDPGSSSTKGKQTVPKIQVAKKNSGTMEQKGKDVRHSQVLL